jgi:dephospho-CoA kinase
VRRSVTVLKVGLTGGIGSGKSTVSSLLKDKGIIIIDADLISREVIEKYPQISQEIRKKFGEQFFDTEGRLLRRKLGDFIFRYNGERKKLEEIIIPFIKQEIFNKLVEYDRVGTKVCVLDAPTLIENGLHEMMDLNILVWVDRVNQIIRLRKRDNLNDEQIANRISAQMNLDRKKEYVNFIIDNSKSVNYTKEQVDEVISILFRIGT